MNVYLTIAGGLVFLTGLVHSLLGEKRIFLPLKNNPTELNNNSSLKLSHLRILWVTWHFATLLGWGYAFLLIGVATLPSNEFISMFQMSTAILFFLSFLLVLFGTRGKHLGWLALLIIAILVYLA